MPLDYLGCRHATENQLRMGIRLRLSARSLALQAGTEAAPTATIVIGSINVQKFNTRRLVQETVITRLDPPGAWVPGPGHPNCPGTERSAAAVNEVLKRSAKWQWKRHRLQ